MILPDQILGRGMILLQEGAIDEALNLLANELGMPSDSADVQHAAAMLAVGIANYPMAETLLRAAIAAGQPRPHYLNDLGAVLFQCGHACRAADAFAHALQIDGTYESAQANLDAAQTFLRQTRRALSQVVCGSRAASLSAPLPDEWHLILPASLKTLCASLRAACMENYPTALSLMQSWLASDSDEWQVSLGGNEEEVLKLTFEAQPNTKMLRPQRELLLLELALQVGTPSIALFAAAALTRHWLARHETQAAQRLERLFLDAWPAQKGLFLHMRHCHLPQADACGNGQRRKLMLIGTCIAEGVRYFLNCSEAFHSRYALQHFITNRAARSMSEFVIADEDLHATHVLVHVHPVWADWSNEQAYVDLLARVPPHVMRISIPYPVFQPLWPFHCRDVRQSGDLPPVFWRPFETRPHYPYGDSLALGMLRETGNVDAAVKKYLALDPANTMDLDRLLDKTLEIMRDKEQHTDVKIVDFIAERFRQTRLFDTVNHISNAGAFHIANQILEKLGLPALDESALNRVVDILSPQMPIHPGVLRHFGLTFCTTDTRYRVDEHRYLNYEEYLTAYLQFA